MTSPYDMFQVLLGRSPGSDLSYYVMEYETWRELFHALLDYEQSNGSALMVTTDALGCGRKRLFGVDVRIDNTIPRGYLLEYNRDNRLVGGHELFWGVSVKCQPL